MELGFIGVGNMGRPMAVNLLRAGHCVRVYDLDESKVAALAGAGAIPVASPAATVEPGGVVFSMVSDDAAVEAIVQGPTGLLQQIGPGGVHVGMSTISLAGTRRIATLYEVQGSHYITATVGGRPEVAEERLLSIYYAGDDAAKARVLPMLRHLGNRLYDLGQEQSAAAGVKLAVNSLIAAIILAMGDAVAFTQKCEVSPEMFSRIVLEASLFGGGGKVFDYIKMLAADTYSPVKFSVPLGEKDTALMRAASAEVGVTLPAVERFVALLEQAIQEGWGDQEWAVVGRVIAQQAGLPVRQTTGVKP